MTNIECIKSMDVESMRYFLCDLFMEIDDGCTNCIASMYCKPHHNGFETWLNMEATEIEGYLEE